MARPKLGETESKRLQMVITEEEISAIDEWQHENRIASRSEAIRRLCQIGLRLDSFAERLPAAVKRALVAHNSVVTEASKHVNRDHLAWERFKGLTKAISQSADEIDEVWLEVRTLMEEAVQIRSHWNLEESIRLADKTRSEMEQSLARMRQSEKGGDA